MLRRSLLVLLGFANARLGGAFQVAVVPPGRQPLAVVSAPRTQNFALRDAASDHEQVEEGEGEGMALSPIQIRFLRKEAGKRRAQKKLRRFSLPEAESSGLFTDESVAAMAAILADHELVDVRGISKGSKKNAFGVSEELALALSYEIGRDAFVIDRNGFAAVMYCPGDENLEGRIHLRTSIGQKNVWEKRVKAPRDNRGQIIADKKD